MKLEVTIPNKIKTPDDIYLIHNLLEYLDRVNLNYKIVED